MRVRVCALAAVALVAAGCSADQQVAPVPSATGAALPSRAALDRVAAAVNLRPGDLPLRFVKADRSFSNDLEAARVTADFATCLGLARTYSDGGVPSPSFRDGQVAPFVDWTSEVSRQVPAVAVAAARKLGSTAGPACYRPVFERIVRQTQRQLDGVTVKDLAVTTLPVTGGTAAAAGSVRGNAVFLSKEDRVTFTLDLVLLADGGFTVTLRGTGFKQEPGAVERRDLSTLLAARLDRALG